MDLSGYFLSDTLTNSSQSDIPPGTIIAPGDHLLVWADGTSSQNTADYPDLHVSFSLAKGGEAIGLFAPDGTIIDAITFGLQTTDVSQGRFPDGNSSIFFMTNPTPRLANLIEASNTAPSLALLNDRTVDEGSLLSFTAVATDADQPPQKLIFSLAPEEPSGARINPDTGVFAWTPTEEQGPGTYEVTIQVTDNGVPSLSATQTISIRVNEVNNPPVLAPILSLNVSEGATITVTNSATDSDTPPQSLTFSLGNDAPEGMLIDPSSGVITWTPSEAQGPGTYSITVRVTDDGEPPLSDFKKFSIAVSEVNLPPQLSFQSNWTIRAETMLAFTAIASDPDLPAQRMTFSLDSGTPSAAHIDSATGFFTWSPEAANVGTNTLSLRVTDDGVPPAFATGTLRVVVLPALRGNISLSGNVATISFGTIIGRTYRVEYKNNLDASSWTKLGEDTTADSGALTFQDTINANTQRFYRFTQLD